MPFDYYLMLIVYILHFMQFYVQAHIIWFLFIALICFYVLSLILILVGKRVYY